jgi:SAM-dependent methyltransferase
MVAQAKQRSIEAKKDIPFAVSAWNELPTKIDQVFDVAFCLGNSVGHCADKQEMISSFKGIRSVLKKNGLLILDSRNWERLQQVKPRFSTTGSRIRNGIRCIPLYVWTFPDRFEDEHLIEVALLFENEKAVWERHYNITYHPFRHSELCDILSSVGFVNIRSAFTEEKDLYTVTAQAG